MDYQEEEVPVVNEEEKWILDPYTAPLVNIVTFGWTEGKSRHYICFVGWLSG